MDDTTLQSSAKDVFPDAPTEELEELEDEPIDIKGNDFSSFKTIETTSANCLLGAVATPGLRNLFVAAPVTATYTNVVTSVPLFYPDQHTYTLHSSTEKIALIFLLHVQRFQSCYIALHFMPFSLSHLLRTFVVKRVPS